MLEEDTEPDGSEVLPKNLVGNQAKHYFRLFKAELEESYKLAESDLALLVNYCNMQEKIDNIHKTLGDNPLALERARITPAPFMKTVLDLTRQQSNIASILGLGVLNRNRVKKSLNVTNKKEVEKQTPKLLQFTKKG